MKRTKGKHHRRKKEKQAAREPERQNLRQQETSPLLEMQQQLGNRAVNALLDGQLQRAGAQAVQDEPLDISGLGASRRLLGHGNLGAAVRAPGPIADVQQRGPFGVEASISFSANPPTITRRPAAEIASSHGRPGVAGWTTPAYNVQVLRASPAGISLSVTLDFIMELATEYTGLNRQILQDHEMGHVNIGTSKAREHFVDNLDTRLESNRALSRANIQSAILAAESAFVTSEGNESQAYDASDYPRMRQAYLGARTPLADLEAASGRIRRMAARLRNFNATVLSATQGQAEVLAQEVIDAYGGLESEELSLLQYNPEFKALVDSARVCIDAFIEQQEYDWWVIEFSMLHASTRQQLHTLRVTLDQFTWRAPE
jgi:hypothetical protein